MPDTRTVDRLLAAATAAFPIYKKTSLAQRAALLRAIGSELTALGDVLLETAHQETHLPWPRLAFERDRTLWQLESFAQATEKGDWLEATIDTADPAFPVAARPDLRKMNVPIGPIVVFGASNFPLAYSTPGGDTASALAVGCPVLVKGHPAHAQTSAQVAAAIDRAVKKAGLPIGVFGHIEGGQAEGIYLAEHPQVCGIGFTGSFSGGKSLYDRAQQRAVPIPVFAEMGSINPVFLFETALDNRAEAIAQQLADSMTASVGQFCTNPGLIVAMKNSGLSRFLTHFEACLSEKKAAPLLHQGIADNYHRRLRALDRKDSVSNHHFNPSDNPLFAHPVYSTVSAADFLRQPDLMEENFGPYTLLVVCDTLAERQAVAAVLEGQLTVSIMIDPAEWPQHTSLIDTLQDKCGRFNVNTVPTGVAVTTAQHHGGPFPATTDARFSAVGADALRRWVRPLAFQNCPSAFLPDALKDSNPLSIPQKINYLR